MFLNINMISVFLYIIIINLFQLIKNQSLCDYNDCFNCSLCGTNKEECNCNWNTFTSNCQNSETKSSFNYNYEYFSNCKDTISLKLQRKYCGNQIITFNEQNISYINLIENDDYYGLQNLYCEYIYDQLFESSNINYNILITISPFFLDDIKIYLTIIYKDNKIHKTPITEQSFNNDYKNPKTIKIQIYLENQFPREPLSIKITRTEKNKNYKLYIAIGIILLACLMCGLIIFCVSRKAAQNARKRQELFLQLAIENQRRREEQLNRIPILSSRDPSSSSETEDNLKEINTFKINELLKTTLAPTKYNKLLGDKHGNPSSVCTICIEEFKEGKSKVSITTCQHVFHFKCLSNWLRQNVLNPKCPNCNYNLLQEKKIEVGCSQAFYDIPEMTINVMRSNDRRATNLERIETFNNHNNSINMEENGLETGENRFLNRYARNHHRDKNQNRNSFITSISISNSSVNNSKNILKNSKENNNDNNEKEIDGNNENKIDDNNKNKNDEVDIQNIEENDINT